MLAATRSPGPGSFCKELSNDAHWLSVAKKQWAAKETFEAYSHGRAIQEIVQECSDTNQPPLKKKKHSDTVRTTLRAELNKMLGELFYSYILLTFVSSQYTDSQNEC
jgi:hypothetical protein